LLVKEREREREREKRGKGKEEGSPGLRVSIIGDLFRKLSRSGKLVNY